MNFIDAKATTTMPTRFGSFCVKVYEDAEGSECMAIIAGDPQPDSEVPVRVHSACLTSEVLGSLKCDCKAQPSRQALWGD
jgi:GTP cyclohydrolase II